MREEWHILGRRSSGDHVYIVAYTFYDNRSVKCTFLLRLLPQRNADDQPRRQGAPHISAQEYSQAIKIIVFIF